METVESRDSTTIAYERTGSGPPLILVHGMAGDHTRWERFGVRRALAEHTTVYAMDRRGPGGRYDFDATRFEGVTTPTVMLVGGESPQWANDAAAALDNALPNSRIAILEGQGHVAMNTAPELFIDEVLAFVHESV